MSSANTTPRGSPSTRSCRICLQPIRGRSHERCRLLGFENRHKLFREEEETKSEVSVGSRISKASSFYVSPPPSPTSTPPGSKAASTVTVSSTRTTQSEKDARRALIPAPTNYPISLISEPSFEIPETGPYHRANPRHVHVPPAPPAFPVPRRAASSLVATEVASTASAAYVFRAASPGPSAVEFLQREGLPGVSISEAGVTDATVRQGQKISDLFDPTILGGDITIKPFCGLTVTDKKYDYWPGNQAHRSRSLRTMVETGALLVRMYALAQMEKHPKATKITLETGAWVLKFFFVVAAVLFGHYISKNIM